jgi:uncharacterized cofD-like protein
VVDEGVVAAGGGHGLSRVLAALTILAVKPVAVVTVADDGGSTGRLRRDLGIIAPGDLRQALVALARNRPLADLFAHRFTRGELEGHALGNLALVALSERTGGDFVAALDEAARLLDCAGRVLPATTEPVALKARVSGRHVEGQARVAASSGRIEQVWLEPAGPHACAEAVAALRRAGTVVLGPGSLFTSVIATLLVPGVAAALRASEARIVYVANLSTQPGETAGFSAAAHVDALLAHVPGLRLDVVVLHEGPVHVEAGEPIVAELDHPGVGTVLRADVARRHPDGRPAPGHDPERLAAALADSAGLTLR